MGGYGSGRHGRTKSVAEDQQCIDVREMARNGLVGRYVCFVMYWGNAGMARATSDPYTLYLECRYPGYSPAGQHIALPHTTCHLGGERIWFQCGNCSRRCAKLHWGRAGWYCRKCYRLDYEIRALGQFDTLVVRKQKLENQLFGDLRKPMRRKRVGRLIKRLVAANDAVDRLIGQRTPNEC